VGGIKLAYSLKAPNPKTQISRPKSYAESLLGVLSLELGIWNFLKHNL